MPRTESLTLPAALFAVALAACSRTPSPADHVRAFRACVPAQTGAFGLVRSLTDEVGQRLTGSSNDPRAVAWAERTMRSLGFANVHTEPVTVSPWARRAESGSVVSPAIRPVVLTALGGSVGTPEGGIEAPVVLAHSIEELDAMPAERARGRVVFVDVRTPLRMDGSGYVVGATVRAVAASHAAKKGAVAALVRSAGTDENRLPHTGALQYSDDAPRIPAAALSAPDAEYLERLVASQPADAVRFRLALDCGPLPDAPGANVVGEVPGREIPGEIVLLAAHLDSWDLADGALDDGAGCAIVLESARLISRAETRPRRTVRVVLFANEEMGLAGGRGYAAAHAGEASHHALALEADLGDGAVFGLVEPAELRNTPAFRFLTDAMRGVRVPTIERELHGGADIGPLRALGVPVIDLRQDATHYFDVHHSANDTLTQVRPAELDRAVLAFATAAYAAAEAPDAFGRATPPARH